MGDVRARRRLLASARARLLEHPDADLPGLPPHLAASWRRSVARGVDPGAVEARHHADLDVGSRWVRCARPVLERLAEQLAAVPVCVVLTDERARVLVRLHTTTGIARAADDQRFAEGFAYDEAAVGTNGVGTVLEAGRSVHVVGAEHFVEPLQPYACAGAPVRDPFTRRIEGVLDVSCRAEHSSPILHSMVASAAAGIGEALLRERDPGQQALFDRFTRVDARVRGAVLGVGVRTVLANSALHTLLDPGDLAALQDHARFRMLRRADVDDRLDLPSGVRVRLRGTAVAAGGTVAGLVATVAVLREAPGPATRGAPEHRAPVPPPPPSRSPAWRAAWTAAAGALGAGAPLLVVGEPGSGRRRLLVDVDRALHGPGHVLALGPGDAAGDLAGRLRRAGPAPLVVLRDVDRWDGVPPGLSAALRAGGARLAATVGTGAGSGPAAVEVLAGFRRSVTVPPLRHRPGDLPALVADVLAEVAPGRDARLSAAALRALARHDWPGGVRELRDALRAALARRPVGTVEVDDLPASCQSAPRSALRPVDRAERDAFVLALRECAGNRAAAAAALGVARSTLYRKIAQYGITV